MAKKITPNYGQVKFYRIETAPVAEGARSFVSVPYEVRKDLSGTEQVVVFSDLNDGTVVGPIRKDGRKWVGRGTRTDGSSFRTCPCPTKAELAENMVYHHLRKRRAA